MENASIPDTVVEMSRAYMRGRVEITGSLIEFFSRAIEMKREDKSRDPKDEYNSVNSVGRNSFLYESFFNISARFSMTYRFAYWLIFCILFLIIYTFY